MISYVYRHYAHYSFTLGYVRHGIWGSMVEHDWVKYDGLTRHRDLQRTCIRVSQTLFGNVYG